MIIFLMLALIMTFICETRAQSGSIKRKIRFVRIESTIANPEIQLLWHL
jgi:hypothetical protein